MQDDLDRILSSEQDVVASSAFVRNVMAVVRREASNPASISFPWGRVAPALAICVVALIAFFVIAGLDSDRGTMIAGPVPQVFVRIVEDANRIGLEWIAIALVASLVPMRLALARS